MADLSLAATVEPQATPPRVRVDVVDLGTPAVTSVTVTRTVVSTGVKTRLRSNDGQPLVLDPDSSVSRSGVIYDYEAPFGEAVVYSTLQQPEVVSSPVVVDADDVWLIHPGLPGLSRPIQLRVGSFQTTVRTANAGVFWPLNRDTAVVVTDGRRKKGSSSFTVRTDTPEDLESLLALINDAGVLLMNVPPLLGLLIDSGYIAILDVNEVRPSDIGEDPARDWEMPFVPVAMPTGGVPTSWTWADVLAQYATWADLMEGEKSWADVMDPTA